MISTNETGAKRERESRPGPANRLAALIRQSARFYKDRIAVVSGASRRSFTELDRRSDRLAASLLRRGLRPGDHVAVLLHNCCEYVEIDFALIKAGLVRVPLNARLSAGELSYIIRDSDSSLVIYGAELAGRLAELLPDFERSGRLIRVGRAADCAPGADYEGLLEVAPSSFEAVPTSEESRYQILYTSGTTGRPKGAVTNVRSRLASLVNVFESEMPVRSTDVFLLCTSMSHGGGTKILPHFLKGARTVLLSEFDVATFCATVQSERVTTTWLVPTMLRMVLDSTDRQRYDLRSLHTIVYAAAPMPVELLRRALTEFGPIFIQVYGLSEAPNPDLVLQREDHRLDTVEDERRLASAGRAPLFVEVRVVDERGRSVAPGELGEIVVRGDNVMTGYWNNPEATAAVFDADGWLHTGDVATVDDDGFVYIVDRKNDMIISGGYNIYPREVEEIIYQHPAVAECAVFGVPDEVWGESVKAVVMPRPAAEVTESELITFCRERLASYKKPRSVEFAASLPLNPNGKIDRRALREPYWQGHSRRV